MKWEWSCNYLYWIWLSRYLVVIIYIDWVIVFRRCEWSWRRWSVLWCWHRQQSDSPPPTYHPTSCLQPVSCTVSGEIILTKLLIILLKFSNNNQTNFPPHITCPDVYSLTCLTRWAGEIIYDSINFLKSINHAAHILNFYFMYPCISY